MITEFGANEICTAVMTSHLVTGENYDGAFSIGYYPGQNNEIWIQAQGYTINVQLDDLNEFIKQLKRAALIAKGQA